MYHDVKCINKPMLSVFLCLFCCACVLLCVAVLEAVHRWRTEKESCLSGEKQAEEEEEESIYTVHHEEVTLPVRGDPRAYNCVGGAVCDSFYRVLPLTSCH